MTLLRDPSNQEIVDALRPYEFGATPDFCEKTKLYINLLLRWNEKVPLTTITSTKEILRFHFGESLFGIVAGRIEERRLADVGSGAGFPGAPLAMALPGLQVILIESNAKKAAFLSELKRELLLQNLAVYRGRAESMAAEERFDIVTARAVGEYAKLLTWARKHLDQAGTGRTVLWLGTRQIDEVRTHGRWEWAKPIPVPKTRGRYVLVGSLSRFEA